MNLRRWRLPSVLVEAACSTGPKVGIFLGRGRGRPTEKKSSFVNPDQREGGAARFNLLVGRNYYDYPVSSRISDGVLGCVMLIDKDVIKHFYPNVFLSSLFITTDESELSLRCSLHGWKTFYVAKPIALHKVGRSTAKAGELPSLYSIRNWALLELLPATPSSKAGRTMPIKFALRVSEAVDPLETFVYNEELTIRVYSALDPTTILQTAVYGSRSKDYRIDETAQHYITNFKTSKTPGLYAVDICRTQNTFVIGSFTFATVK